MELPLNLTVNIDYERMHRRIREIINEHAVTGELISLIEAELLADDLVREYVSIEVCK